MISQLLCRARFIAFLVLLELSCLSSVGALEIIVNDHVVSNQITNIELQAIFTMRIRNWPDGLPIRVFVLGDTAPEQVEFAKKILDTFPYQLRRYWDRLVFSGTGQAPIELNSSLEMYNRVAATPGAIGYLPTEYIGKQVRIIKVINQ